MRLKYKSKRNCSNCLKLFPITFKTLEKDFCSDKCEEQYAIKALDFDVASHREVIIKTDIKD